MIVRIEHSPFDISHSTLPAATSRLADRRLVRYYPVVSSSLSTVLRHGAAVLVGYLTFAVPTAALFAFSHRDPHAPQDWVFVVFSIVYGVISAILAGYVAGIIARSRPIAAARTLSLAIAAVAIVSMLARPGAGAVWSQLVAIFLLAPSALVGGWLRSMKR